MKTLVIFDLDGTLLNTIDDLGNAANAALAAKGFPTHTLAAYPMMVGNGITKLLERALPEDCRSQATVTALREEFIKYYDEHLYDCTTPYDGIPALLAELTARGINIAVASNKYESAVKRLIEHFFPNDNFKSVCGNIDGVPTKPDPSVVFRVLTECPTPKSETLYVGDSGIDIETARRACIDNAGVTWGFRSEGELRRAYADHIITDPAEILSLLN